MFIYQATINLIEKIIVHILLHTIPSLIPCDKFAPLLYWSNYLRTFTSLINSFRHLLIPFAIQMWVMIAFLTNLTSMLAIFQSSSALAKRLPALYKLYYPDCLLRDLAWYININIIKKNSHMTKISFTLEFAQSYYFGSAFIIAMSIFFQVIDFTWSVFVLCYSIIANFSLLLEVLQVRQYSNLSCEYNFANSGS